MMTEEKIEGKALAAIYESDTKTLDRLIKRGLSVNMKMYGNSSLLSCAVFSSNEVMVRYLLSKGADPTWTNSWNGQPLIETAFEHGETNICELLYAFTPVAPEQEPEKEVRIIAGFPENILEQIINPTEIKLPKPLFVTFNEADAPAELMDWLRQYLSDIRPGTQAEYSGDEKDENGNVVKLGHIRDKDTKEAGYDFFIWIERIEGGYEWGCGAISGPLSGTGGRGKLIKKYGRWFQVDVTVWRS